MRLGAYHDEIVRSNNVLDKELSSGVRYATLSRVLVEMPRPGGDAPPAQRGEVDHLHVPLPVLVPSQASSLLPDFPDLHILQQSFENPILNTFCQFWPTYCTAQRGIAEGACGQVLWSSI